MSIAEGQHMISEIREQPEALKRTYEKSLSALDLVAKRMIERKIKRVFLIGCGTSYYASVAGEYGIREYTQMSAVGLPASEYMLYFSGATDKEVAVIGISRSGETTETVEAMNAASKRGALTVAITSTPKSTMAKRAAIAVDTYAGEEKSVVMTKTFSTQTFATYLLALSLARYTAPSEEIEEKIKQSGKIPHFAEETISACEPKVKSLAKELHKQDKFVYLGSGPSHATCLEGALKLKESSYVFAEAMPSMEFRHGPMALIDETSILAVAPVGKAFKRALGVVSDIKSQEGQVILFTNDESEAKLYGNYGAYIPMKLDEYLSPVMFIIPLQLFAYYFSMNKGLNPDVPRHLVKVVKLQR